MRRVFPILLLVVFAYQWFGYLLSFKLLQQYQKQVIKSQISAKGYQASDAKLLKIPVEWQKNNALFSWEEEGEEFIYQNRWYDVVSSFTENDTTYFYCLHDIVEQRLVSHFHKNNSSQWDFHKIDISKLLQIENYFPIVYHLSYYQVDTKQVYFSNWLSKNYFIFLEKHSPPPQNEFTSKVELHLCDRNGEPF